MGRHVATFQPIWDCRWSQPPLQILEDRKQPESRCVCVRTPGRRRPVTEEECEDCGFWETGEFIDPLSRC
jgi:hypothetical protein